jgi:two-component SAPR family response regulator
MKEKYTNLLFEVVKFYIQEGSTKQAVEILKSGLRRDPLNKVLNYELLKELKRSNDRVALLKYYDIYRKHLETELGMEPDNDCKNLVRL